MNLSVTLVTLLTAISCGEEDEDRIGVNVSDARRFSCTKTYASLKSVKIHGDGIQECHLAPSFPQRNETFSFAAFWLLTPTHCHVLDSIRIFLFYLLACFIMYLVALSSSSPLFVAVISGSICMCVRVVESSLQILITARLLLASVLGVPRHRPSSWLGFRHKLVFLLANHPSAAVDLPQSTEHKCCQKTYNPFIASSSEGSLMHGWLNDWFDVQGLINLWIEICRKDINIIRILYYVQQNHHFKQASTATGTVIKCVLCVTRSAHQRGSDNHSILPCELLHWMTLFYFSR